MSVPFLLDIVSKYHSLKSDEHAYIRFINKTGRTVYLLWVDFNGKLQFCRTLQKDYYVDINTYKTHPWIAVDADSKDVMHLDRSYVYLPKTSREALAQRFANVPDNYEARSRVAVTLPVHTLKHLAMMTVRNQVKSPDQVLNLEIPHHLKLDLWKEASYYLFLKALKW